MVRRKATGHTVTMRTDRRWDGEIVALAVPAAATLAAEPAYLLTDTALVGTLGTEALAGLAVANTIILAAYTVFIFLTFATTAAVARLLGAERHRDAAEEGVTATWLGAMLGVMVAAVVLPLAPTLARLFGAEAAVVADAVTYLRISTAGFPALLIVMAGAGFRRGHHDTRTPLYVGFGTALINLVIEVVLLIVLDFGIGASALSTVIAQWVGALVYVALVAAEARRHQVGLAPHLGRIGTQLRVGSALIVRTVPCDRSFSWRFSWPDRWARWNSLRTRSASGYGRFSPSPTTASRPPVRRWWLVSWAAVDTHSLSQRQRVCCSGRSRCRLRWGWRPCWGTRWSQACSAAILSW